MAPSAYMLSAIVLAAGQGTRMKSNLPKVLHELSGAPMVAYPVRLAKRVGADPIVLVVGHGAEKVKAAVPEVRFQLQAEQKGTGHAVMEGMKGLEGFEGRVLILYGDVPLLTEATIRGLIATVDQGADLAIVSTILDDPFGYGRITRENGRVTGVVEEKDATDAQRQIKEGNAGIYCVGTDFLRRALSQLKNDNASGEYYLTDIVGIAIREGLKVETFIAPEAIEVQGANNRVQLAELGAHLQKRINEAHMAEGVAIIDPTSTYIGIDVSIGRDTVIQPGVHLRGQTKIGVECRIDAGAVITNTTLQNGVTVNAYSVLEEAELFDGSTVGPYARIRPGAKIMEGARVGNFVELKKTTLGKGAKANHLAYLGDSEIGEGANVGAGTITCNYDGYGKHKTIIGDGVFVGSNSTLVAPLNIGEGAYVAAGSTITYDVGKDDLAFGRARQQNKTGRAEEVRATAKAKAGK